MTDSRLDALRDMLLEGRNPEALRLIAEIATEQPKLSPLEKLRALRRDILRDTGQPVEFEINVSDDAAVHILEHLQPGCAEAALRSADRQSPQSRRRMTLADGIAVFASEHLRRRGSRGHRADATFVDDVMAAAIPAPWVCQHCGEWRADGNAVAHDCRPHL